MQVIFKCSNCLHENVDIFSVYEVNDNKNLVEINFICPKCGEGDIIPAYLYRRV